jgi:hypothetical protein
MRRLSAQQARRPPGVLVLPVLLLLLAPASGLLPLAHASGPFDGRFLGYRVDNATFSMVDLPSPTTLDMPIDNMTAQLDLGFETRLFNDATVNFWVGSNGFISVFKKEDPGCCEGQALPAAQDPNGLVAGLWTHFDPTAGGSVGFQGFSSLERPGLDAQAAMVVRWQDLPVAGGGGNASFEVIVLADGAFEVQVEHAQVPAGLNATIGAENFDGTKGVQIARGALALDHVAWRLVPIYQPLVPDLVVEGVRVAVPNLPTDPWSITVHVANRGIGNFLQAKLRLTATPLEGPLRGTSPGCTVLLGEKPLYEFDPDEEADVRYTWAPPVDPNDPTAPRIGDFRFDAQGTVLQSAEPERNLTNNAGSAEASYLVPGQGGTDLLCQRVPGLPGLPILAGIGQEPAPPGGA